MNNGGGLSALDNQSMDPGELPSVLEGMSCWAHISQSTARTCNQGRGKGEGVEGCAGVSSPPGVMAAQAAPERWYRNLTGGTRSMVVSRYQLHPRASCG